MADRVSARERRAQVMVLRRQRATFAHIGRALGLSTSRAWHLYQEALAEQPSPDLEEHRAEELLLADDAISDLLKIARDHARPRTSVEAWNSIKGWSERKARLSGVEGTVPERRVEADAIDDLGRDELAARRRAG